MKHVIHLLFSSLMLVPLSAQSVAEKRAYFRLGAAMSQNDLKVYLGDRSYSPIYEIGYDFNGPTEETGLGVYVSYLTAHGDPIERYDGLRQVLFGWRFGVDMRFSTPIKGLTPFMGFSANFYDGQVRATGVVQDVDNINTKHEITPRRWPESRPKIGVRFGIEYRINESWGVVVDGSASTWLSRNSGVVGAANIATGQRYYKGINPVSPSWINLAVQYRWNVAGLF